MTTIEPLSNIPARWGDLTQQDEFDFERNQEITTETEPAEDGSVRKTVVEYKTNDKGQTIQIIKKIKVYKAKVKMNRRVEERKKWRKFGECANAPRGPEPGITSVGDEVFLDLVASGEEGDAKPKKEGVNIGVICRNCGKSGDHWTLKCPYFKSGSTVALSDREPIKPDLSGSTTYVAPGVRRFASGATNTGESDSRRPPRDESATIRVTNLSEDTKEADLSELFRSFGHISRIYLAKDKITGLSKGFAFINFVYREDAAKAIEKLSGKFGYDHLILHLEWAKPSNK